MKEELKKVLVVDDSEIDREILKSILGSKFDIIEAVNGYYALEIILKNADQLDAILLDVSMPVLDGFSVLRLMRENYINNIPVFLITAEATKDNVERAAQFNVSEFIVKPFEREEIVRRLESKLGIVVKPSLMQTDIEETKKYILDFATLYKKYLVNFNEDVGHYMRMTGLMRILLNRYLAITPEVDLSADEMEIISNASFFCDVGDMMIPQRIKEKAQRQEDGGEAYQSHTVLGADFVRLNTSRHCEFFVQICSDMCAHHHERYDGNGFPHKVAGNNNSIYTQMCRVADQFDPLFTKYRDYTESQFKYVVGELEKDAGAFSPEILSLLSGCMSNIISYYHTKG
ncbi:MAG: response regulator [Eubacteriales bacterium]|nr:response regulator [Eubacteriales bacterium]